MGNSSATIIKSYSRCDIDASGETESSSYIGGLVGKSTIGQTIDESYAIGNIRIGSNGARVGGLIGEGSGNSSNKISINNAYSAVNISGEGNYKTNSIYNTAYTGTLVGSGSYININNTYMIGKIDVKKGIITASNGSNSYWSPETVGINANDLESPGEARSIQEMLYEKNYVDWDFKNIWKIDSNGGSLPYLLDKKETELLRENFKIVEYEGDGTEDNPFLIYNIEQFQYVKQISGIGKYYYKIMNDINAENFGAFEPINKFYGVLDGNGYTVSNLNIDSSKLMYDNGYIYKGGIISYNNGRVENIKLHDLNMIDIEVTDGVEKLYIGGVIGYNNGWINNVEITGNIENNSCQAKEIYIGQIIGYNGGYINRAHSDAILQTTQISNLSGSVTNVGGISGGASTGFDNGGLIKLSYNTGTIIVNSTKAISVGGIVPIGNIYYSYSKGNIKANQRYTSVNHMPSGVYTYCVDTVELNGVKKPLSGSSENSYWNINGIEGQEQEGTSPTLEQMKQQSTYKNWDFDKIWAIEENQNTPTIRPEVSYYWDDAYWKWYTKSIHGVNLIDGGITFVHHNDNDRRRI